MICESVRKDCIRKYKTRVIQVNGKFYNWLRKITNGGYDTYIAIKDGNLYEITLYNVNENETVVCDGGPIWFADTKLIEELNDEKDEE